MAELDKAEMNIVPRSQGLVEKGVQRSLSRVWSRRESLSFVISVLFLLFITSGRWFQNSTSSMLPVGENRP